MLTRPTATRAFLALVVTLSVVVPVGAALTGCPNWARPQCGAPGAYPCVDDWPRYCAAATGELTPIGDEACAASGRVCALRADGVAYCARAAADGGAR